MTQVLRSFQEYEVTLPDQGTPEWDELVLLLFRRPDMRTGYFSVVETVVSALISEAIGRGGTFNYPGYEQVVNGRLRMHTLATVTQLPAISETVFDPGVFRIALADIDVVPVDDSRFPIVRSLRERLQRLVVEIENLDPQSDDEELVEAVLRGAIDDLTDFAAKRYGS